MCAVTIYKERFRQRSEQRRIEKPAKHLRLSISRKQLTAESRQLLGLGSEYAFRDAINKFTPANANLSFLSNKLQIQSSKLKKH